MKSQKTIARTFGVFFILAFASYGAGSGRIASLTDVSTSLNNVSADSTSLVISVILMALVHTIVNIGLPVLMQPLLQPVNKILSMGYLSAGIAATITLIVGAILVMLFVPLSSMYTQADVADHAYFETIGALLVKANFYAYQIGMAIWGFGGLMLCYLLFTSKLVPRGLAVWGLIGYFVFIAGTIAELFDLPIGVQLALPGGLFEIALSIYLIVKGFRKTELTN